MSKSIIEIKQILQQETVSQEFLKEWEKDSRKGVQQALKSYYLKEEKRKAQFAAFQKRLAFEKELHQKGLKLVAGIDEVGRGPLAGPVVACCVILPETFSEVLVTDSKQLSLKNRETLYEKIEDQAVDIGLGVISETVIDKINIYQAAKLAMTHAVKNLSFTPEHLLIDAMTLDLDIPQTSLIKGDARSVSIGAASIIAKVTRDHLMEEYDRLYPGYGFSKNAGYGTKEHLLGLEKLGPCPIHRKTFSPVKKYL